MRGFWVALDCCNESISDGCYETASKICLIDHVFCDCSSLRLDTVQTLWAGILESLLGLGVCLSDEGDLVYAISLENLLRQ